MKAKVNRVTIELVQNSTLVQAADAIVVVTDTNLSVFQDLAALAGPTVARQTSAIGWSAVGTTVATDAGTLAGVRKILHTVGPHWGQGSERARLGNATWSSLQLAESLEAKSVALPAISVGTLGYPVEACAQIMIERTIDVTFEPLKYLRTVFLCLENLTVYEVFLQEFTRQIEDLRATGEGKVRA